MEHNNYNESFQHGGFTMKRTMRKRIEKLKVANFEGAHKFNATRIAALEKQKAKIAAEAALAKRKKRSWGFLMSENKLAAKREKITEQTEQKIAKANNAAKREIYHEMKKRAKIVQKQLPNYSKISFNITDRSKKLKGNYLDEKLQQLRKDIGIAESTISDQRASKTAAAAKAIEDPRRQLMKGIEEVRNSQNAYRLSTVEAEQAKQKVNKMIKGDYFEKEYLKQNKSYEQYQADLEIAQLELQNAETQKREKKLDYEGKQKTLPLLKKFRKDMYAAEKRFRATTIEGLESKLAGVKRETPTGALLTRKLAEKERKAAKSRATTSTKSAENIAKSTTLDSTRKKIQFNTNYTKRRVLSQKNTKRKEATVEAMIKGKNIDEQNAIKQRFEKYAEAKQLQSELIQKQIDAINIQLKVLKSDDPNYKQLTDALEKLTTKQTGIDLQKKNANEVITQINTLIPT